jgi:hypothetical protein
MNYLKNVKRCLENFNFLKFYSIYLVYPTQAFLLGLLVTFVDNFHFNLVVIFVYFVNQ